MEFSKEFLRELVDDEYDRKEVEILENKLVDTDRWSKCYDLTFKVDGKIYGTGYRRGATEMQDESPFEFESDMIKCWEMEAAEVVTIEYKTKKGSE